MGMIPSLSALQRRFNLAAFLAARHMKPEAYGTFDVSLEWPLPLHIHNVQFDAGGLGGAMFLTQPKIGFHTLVLNASLTATTALSPNASLILELIGGIEPNTQLQTLVTIPFTNQCSPLIGGISTPIPWVAGGPILQGIRPVYVPETFGLRLSIGGAFPMGGFVEWTEVTYPSTQPLTSLLSYGGS